jgi:hypothetical protein
MITAGTTAPSNARCRPHHHVARFKKPVAEMKMKPMSRFALVEVFLVVLLLRVVGLMAKLALLAQERLSQRKQQQSKPDHAVPAAAP